MVAQLINALTPGPAATNFPYPNLVQVATPAGAVTYEGPTINGIPMPGQWLLTKASRDFGWQKQQATFMTGAYLVPIGDPLMDIEYEVRIFESGTMGAFITLLGTLLKKPVITIPGSFSSSAALGIQDKVLKILGVSKVVTASIDFPKNPLITSGGKGAWIGHVSFIEYRPAKAALPIPDQSIPDPGAVTPAAVNNVATSQAAIAAGDAVRQATNARALLNR